MWNRRNKKNEYFQLGIKRLKVSSINTSKAYNVLFSTVSLRIYFWCIVLAKSFPFPNRIFFGLASSIMSVPGLTILAQCDKIRYMYVCQHVLGNQCTILTKTSDVITRYCIEHHVSLYSIYPFCKSYIYLFSHGTSTCQPSRFCQQSKNPPWDIIWTTYLWKVCFINQYNIFSSVLNNFCNHSYVIKINQRMPILFEMQYIFVILHLYILLLITYRNHFLHKLSIPIINAYSVLKLHWINQYKKLQKHLTLFFIL